MKLVNDRTIGAWIPLPSPLEGLIARLGRLSKAPAFAAQRQMALSRALQSYLATGNEAPLAPLDQEVHLAELYVYADYYPEDGQLTLIEQLRDVITEHIPEEERQWLDPLQTFLHGSYRNPPVIRREKPFTVSVTGQWPSVSCSARRTQAGISSGTGAACTDEPSARRYGDRGGSYCRQRAGALG